MTITSKAVAKVAAVATGLAMATSMLSLAPMAHAQAATSCGFTHDLTIGATGSDVMCLQSALIAAGFSIPAGATGYFGTQTKAAVAAWQTSRNVAPAAGYFGPISRAAWNLGGTGGTVSTVPGCVPGALFSTTTGQSCSNVSTVPGCVAGALFSMTTGQSCSGGATSGGALTGAGRLTNVDSAGAIESDLKEGDAATAVIAVDADAKDGDVAVQRMDVDLEIGTTNPNTVASSANITKYISSVAVYLDGKKLGEMDAAAGDKTSRTWEYRFSGLNGVIKKGETGELTVKVTPVDSIGANEDGEEITASIPDDGIRAVGGDGISDTYGLSLDTETFTVSSATIGQLTLAENSSNPDDSVVKVDADVTTDDVTLLSTNLKAKKQDVTVHDFPVQLCTDDNSINDVVQTVKLMRGSTTVKTKSVPTGTTCANVVFDNIDRDISKDSTEGYSVVATLKKQDGNYSVGATVVASTTEDLAWDVEDANGDTVTPTGSTLGGTMTLQTTGITVVRGTVAVNYVSGAAGPVPDRTTYKIPFTVTAGEDDLWIASSSALMQGVASAAGKTTWATTTDSTTGTTDQGVATLSASGSTTSDDSDGNFKIGAGASRTFTLQVTLEATANGSTGVRLTGIGYGTAANTIDQVYDTGLSDFKTDVQFMSAN